MTVEQQQTHLNEFTDQMGRIICSKGNDYAGQNATTDRLNNFKVVAAITNTTPQQACLNLIATKVARLGVLFSSGKLPNNESIQDSVIDLACYTALLDMILSEQAEGLVKPRKNETGIYG
jgi:hypothetical protein